jgi:hypothetical protein
MKTAKEYWKEKFDEYPQTDADKLAVTMMQEYAKQAIADHEAGVCEWEVDKAEEWSAIPGCYRLYEWTRISSKDIYCRFCGRKIKRV